MTPNDSETKISRRAVLRRGAFATGVVTIGTTAFSGTALASICPKTPGFWANHNWCEVAVDPNSSNTVGENLLDCSNVKGSCGPDCTYTLAGEKKTMSQWQTFLTSPMRGDKGKIMAKHLLALHLNWQLRPDPDPDCVDKTIDMSQFGLGNMSMDDVWGAASEWLRESNWPDSKQDSWVVDGTDGEPLKNVIDAFNNGNLSALDCDCGSAGDEDGQGNGQGEGKGGGESNGQGRGNSRGKGADSPPAQGHGRHGRR